MAKKAKTLESWDEMLEIDLHTMDDALRDQPTFMRKASGELAMAEKQAKEAKAAFKLVKADLETKIRDEPEEYGIAKATERSVEATAILQEEYQEAEQEMIDADYRRDLLDGLVESLREKRTSLSKLSDLWLGQYWGEVPVKRKATEAMAEEAVDKRLRNRSKSRSSRKDS